MEGDLENPHYQRQSMVNTNPQAYDHTLFLSSYEEDNVDHTLRAGTKELPRNTHRRRKPAEARNYSNIPAALPGAVYRGVQLNSVGHVIAPRTARSRASQIGAKKRLRAEASSSLRSLSRALGVTMDEEAREYYRSPCADSNTPFTQIHDDPGKKQVFAPFVDITEQAEAELLQSRPRSESQELKYRQRRQQRAQRRQQRTLHVVDINNGNSVVQDSRVRQRLRRVHRRVRTQFLKEGVATLDFLRRFEDEVVEYLEHYDGHQRMTPILTDSCDRLLAHGLCQFHGLESYTKETAEGPQIYVFKPRDYDPALETPIVRLSELVRDMTEAGYTDY